MKKQDTKKNFVTSISGLLPAAAILLAPAAVLAAGGEGSGGGSAMDWVWKILNFVILVVILYYFAKFMNIKGYFQQRKDLIENSIRESREAKELALKALAEVEERLKLKDSEVQAIIANAESSGQKEKERLIAEGEQLKAKILEQAKANIEYETRLAKEAIKTEAVEAAMQLAEQKIRQKLSKEDQEKLLSDSFRKLEGKK
ncbi:MAG: ATP synthase F0 subunit B [Nitrospiraceae bacterium]|nr:ATP synthase F0 subunit B [Nitrospiraceae bacterium]